MRNITYLGIRKDDSGWEHFLFSVSINGQVFEYKTGLGHAKNADKRKLFGVELKPKMPKIRDILWCLVSDARAGEMLFEDFCNEFGYDSDSISALKIYSKCQETALKLRKAMKSKNYVERVNAWEL